VPDPVGGAHFAPDSKTSAVSTTVQLALHTTRLDDSAFWLGALLTPPADAHLYWINPGESGLATTAEFHAPRGYRLSEVEYPGPSSWTSERGMVAYGYAGSTALLVRVMGDGSDLTARFSVFASWLSCDELCVKESGEASLDVGSAAPSTRQLDPFIARLPAPGSDISVERVGPTEVLLAAPLGVTLLEYFPLTPLALDERAPTSTPEAQGSVRVQLGNDRPLRGVVRALVQDETKYFELEESVERAQPKSQ
jgi:thiol:disulfide interchange protein DsbD